MQSNKINLITLNKIMQSKNENLNFENLYNKEDLVVLAIESSCDETACAIVRGGREILSNVVATQIEIHRRFGGVVPEIASRNHILTIENVVKEAMEQAKFCAEQIDAVAVTYGAGLLGALLVGVSYAKGLAYAWGKPLVAVSHVNGHLAANYLGSDLTPPYLCLLASGGHTAILKVDDYEKTHLLGSTRDDAAGEAFDKVARILGLPYPGGPEIEKLAREGKAVIKFPRPTFKKNDALYFSYSGLKTAVTNFVHTAEQKGEEIVKADVAASFQTTAVAQMFETTMLAVEQTGARKVAIAGGVSANGELRAMFDKEAKRRGLQIYYPPLKLCTDNAAMIAAAGYYKVRSKTAFADLSLDAKATVSLGD